MDIFTIDIFTSLFFVGRNKLCPLILMPAWSMQSQPCYRLFHKYGNTGPHGDTCSYPVWTMKRPYT